MAQTLLRFGLPKDQADTYGEALGECLAACYKFWTLVLLLA
jgi:hypothetical protein